MCRIKHNPQIINFIVIHINIKLILFNIFKINIKGKGTLTFKLGMQFATFHM